MRTRRLAAGIAVLGAMGSLGGCASASPQWEGLPPSDTYAAALTDLRTGDPVAGRASLAQVMEICGTTALGERATLALIVDALDPRHPDLDLAASLSHAYLSQPYRTPTAEQFATSAYLVSLDVGGTLDESLSILPSADPSEFPAECRGGSLSPTYRGVAVVPVPPSQSRADRIADLESSIEALETELARVRETLRP
ncbi:MAG: hypothetical protein KJO44_09125 [Gemmatimonadetes bacterium]|nr:hypothetical protein [Gemmatimonadota bacterium]MBT8479916.1 hypothetical protein [Gemmatimonadota bacterium]NNK47441.1 hypothetical protein [Gemmatimonadota bacterium]